MPVTPVHFKFDKGWEVYEKALSHPRFMKFLKPEIKKSLDVAGFAMRKTMRSHITGKVGVKNAALTIAIKGSTTPLADYGDLFAAQTHRLSSDGMECFIGVLATAKARDGKSLVNIGEGLHEGMRIEVTAKMRRMFWYLSLASEGHIDPGELTGRAKVLFERYQHWKPLRRTTTHIVIPSRPWIRLSFADETFRAKFQVEMQNAVKRALKKAIKS